MWSRGVKARDKPGELPVRRRRSAALVAVVGLLALVGAGFLALTGREKAKDLAAAWARGLDVSSHLEQLSVALRDSAAAAARFEDAGEDGDAHAQKDAADRAGRALRELGRLVPDGSPAEDARARLELLANDTLAADADKVQARRGNAPAGRNSPELGRLLAERAHAAADDLDRRIRQTADSQMAEVRAGLLRDLGWLLAVLTAALVLFAGASASLLQSPSGAQDRAVYLSAAEVPRAAPPMVQNVLDTLSDGVLVFDAHGTLLASSPSAAAILDLDARGAGAGKRRGPPRGLYLPSDDAPESSVRNPLARAIAGERVEGIEMSVGPPSDPASRRVILSARPLRDADGTRRGAAVVLRDITDMKNAEAELAKARAEHAEVVLGHEQAIAAVLAGEQGRLGAERLQAEEERDRAVTERNSAEAARKAAEASRARAEGELKKAEAEVTKAKLVLKQREAGADDVTEEHRLREFRARGDALVSKLRETRLALAALTTRPPVCPTCASDRAARGFWSRVAKAVEEASCPECASLARKALPARRGSAESGRPAEDSLVGPGGER